MTKLTLQAGDYIRTEGLSLEQCEKFMNAMIEAGADRGEGLEYYDEFHEGGDGFGWDSSSGCLWHCLSDEGENSVFIRDVTYQFFNQKEMLQAVPRQPPTDELYTKAYKQALWDAQFHIKTHGKGMTTNEIRLLLLEMREGV